MQTFAIFLIGYIYDKRVIILSVLLSFTLFDSQFLVDKFSLFTHTFGYKFSFILSGLFINYYKNKINNQALLFMLASVIIFIFGVSYLGFYIDDMRKAVYVGFLPFIIPDIIKISAVISIIRFFKLN
jgi:biotin transport system substrate-specific component